MHTIQNHSLLMAKGQQILIKLYLNWMGLGQPAKITWPNFTAPISTLQIEKDFMVKHSRKVIYFFPFLLTGMKRIICIMKAWWSCVLVMETSFLLMGVRLHTYDPRQTRQWCETRAIGT